jgi:hypothetical protein
MVKLDADGIPVVLEQHIAVIDVHRDVFAIYPRCKCGWTGGAYKVPLTSDDDAPERVLVRSEIWDHIIEVLEQEAGWKK